MLGQWLAQPRPTLMGRGPTSNQIAAIYCLFISFVMAGDLNARRVTINYDGGSFDMALGNIKGLFGESLVSEQTAGKEVTVSVKSHTRTRVIGGPSTNVAANSYTYTQFPSSSSSLAAGGEEVAVWWEGSNGKWISRVSGPLWKFGEYLNSAAEFDTFFRAAGGKTYGPFRKV